MIRSTIIALLVTAIGAFAQPPKGSKTVLNNPVVQSDIDMSNHRLLNLDVSNLSINIPVSPVFTSNGLGQTPDDTKGVAVQNTTPATAILQQWSPEYQWIGQGWSINSGQSFPVQFRSYLVINLSGNSPNGYLTFEGRGGGVGNWTSDLNLFTNGGISVGGTSPPGVGIINAQNGYKIGGLNPTNGHVLRANGVNFVDSQLGYSDLGFVDASLAGVTNGSTATLVPGKWYQGTVSSNLTVAFSTSLSAGGPSTGLRILVTSPFTLTFPASYEVGENPSPTTITTKAIGTGYHEISWVISNGNVLMADSISGGIISAQTLYVAGSNGNDTTGTRGDRAHPFATIQSAHDHASAGDTIEVMSDLLGSGVLLTATKQLTVDLHWHKITSASQTDTQKIVLSTDGCVVKNLEINGTWDHSSSGTTTGPSIASTNKRTRIENVYVHDLQDTGVSLINDQTDSSVRFAKI